ncbi:hypothetical protein OIDMADRAFT_174078 [Oidiodendron maius Zn]|uniref:Uncharacterized protein n=1 Tax=Oidiodendron maius (strain Zn) TaxID=913774 RepID=A0A0C3DY09_OIDMZ|nr:hypothetical protein OIDMADRAFT_174078 [Oidiodendron maius Zn]
MASPAWSSATIASLRRPMPRHFLLQQMTTLLPFQMPLGRQLLHQRSQQALIQELIQVHLRQISHLPRPKVKVLQHTRGLQQRQEKVITDSRANSLVYQSTNAQNVPKL